MVFLDGGRNKISFSLSYKINCKIAQKWKTKGLRGMCHCGTGGCTRSGPRVDDCEATTDSRCAAHFHILFLHCCIYLVHIQLLLELWQAQCHDQCLIAMSLLTYLNNSVIVMVYLEWDIEELPRDTSCWPSREAFSLHFHLPLSSGKEKGRDTFTAILIL